MTWIVLRELDDGSGKLTENEVTWMKEVLTDPDAMPRYIPDVNMPMGQVRIYTVSKRICGTYVQMRSNMKINPKYLNFLWECIRDA